MSLFVLRTYVPTPPAVRDTQPPTVPGNFAVVLSGNNPVLSWTASTDNVAVAGYQIFASYAGGPLDLIAITSALNYTDTAAPPGVSCDYAVQAFDPSANESGLTNSKSVTTPGGSTADITAPPVPVLTLVAQTSAPYTYEVSWPPVIDTGPGGSLISGTAGYLVFENGVQVANVPNPNGASGALTAAEIGSPAVSGSDNGTGILVGGGSNHYGTSDQFFFDYEPIQGDFDVVMEVDSIISSTGFAFPKGGMEMRFTLDPASPYFNSSDFGARGGANEYRLLAGGQAAQSTFASVAPGSRHLQRRGNVMTMRTSTTMPPPAFTDASWVVQGTPQTFANMPAVVLVGRFGCAGQATGTVTMGYSHFSLTGASPAIFNGTGNAGTSKNVQVKSYDVVGNVSALSTALVVTWAGAATTNISMIGSYSIGGTRSPSPSVGYGSAASIAQVSKERSTVYDMYPGLDGQNPSAYSMAAVMATVAAANPGWWPFGYTDLQTISPSNDANSIAYCKANHYLLESAYPGSNFIQFEGYWVANVCQTAVDPTDSHGRDFVAYGSAYWNDLYRNASAAGLAAGPNVANPTVIGPFLDDQQCQPETTGDWLRNGNTNTTTQGAAVRAGSVALMNTLRASKPGTLIAANTSGMRPAAATITEYVGQIDVAVMEAMGGEFFSPEAFSNITEVIRGYQKEKTVIRSGGHGMYVLNNCRADGSVPETWNSNDTVATFFPAFQGIRYEAGKCFCLTDNVLFCCSSSTGAVNNEFSGQPPGYDCNTLRWFDFFEVNHTTGVHVPYASATAGFSIFNPAQRVDAAQTTPWLAAGSTNGPLGVFRRQFLTATVYVNPRGNGARTIALGATHTKWSVTDDSTMNGGTISSWNAADGDALFVIN